MSGEPPIAFNGPPNALMQFAAALGGMDRPYERCTVRRFHPGDARCLLHRGHDGSHLFGDETESR